MKEITTRTDNKNEGKILDENILVRGCGTGGSATVPRDISLTQGLPG